MKSIHMLLPSFNFRKCREPAFIQSIVFSEAAILGEVFLGCACRFNGKFHLENGGVNGLK